MMDNRWYSIKISPEVIKNDLFVVNYDQGNETFFPDEFCCNETTTTTTVPVTGYTLVYSSMTDILSGGTNGDSLLTGLTVPILLTETTIDIGYYSVFDGFVLQKDTMTNFLFSGDPFNNYLVYFYNTSEKELKKYLSFSNYTIDWGDGSPIQIVNSTAPTFYSHNYLVDGEYTITMSGTSPWGVNIIKKDLSIPLSGVTISNPNGTAYFIPAGGSWSGTPLMYDYLFTGDSICDVNLQSSYNYTTVPFLVTGYTNSYVNDLEVWGNRLDPSRFDGRFKLGIQITGTAETVGTFWGPSFDNTYTAYTINGIDYYDYEDGTTLFVVESSGFTPDWLVCSAITKNELLLNVIDEAEIQSNVFIERGKNSAFERVQRLGEIDNVGDLEKYGYKFFNVIKI